MAKYFLAIIIIGLVAVGALIFSRGNVNPREDQGYLTGRVTLGPVCPVERIPPDPACAPKPYQILISLKSTNVSTQTPTDAAGVFGVSLVPGTYNLTIKTGAVYPRCETREVTVKANSTTIVDLSCDTGIR